VISVLSEASGEHQFILATLPPARRQKRLALAVAVALIVAFAVTLPFTTIKLPTVYAFIPALQTALLVSDLLTAALLFAQFTILQWRALLALASGYLFTSMIVIPHALTFPGVITTTGGLGAGPQTTAWLYIFWHLGLPSAALAYGLFKEPDRANPVPDGRALTSIAASVAIVLLLVCGLAWIATVQEPNLPRILDDEGHLSLFGKVANGFMLFMGALALALLWVRRRSVLDLWLMVVILAFLIEIALSAVLADVRFSLGYYAGRLYSLITAATVLIVILSETTAVHAHLVRSIMRQRGAREERRAAMDAMAASIAHEVNQPLGAMVANANAALRWLTNKKPDLERAHAALERVVSSGHRAGEVVASVRSMFKKDVHGRALLSVNDLILQVLAMVEVDLRMDRISVSTKLCDDLPQLLVDRGQLQQVFLNLIMNAIESMRSVTDRAHSLLITSDIIPEPSTIVVTIEDSGCGIRKEHKDRIFDTFFSTKSAGTGIGLSICRSIIESHGGSVQASDNAPAGTVFCITLPSGDF
jgi:signal transduction histidine kinase